MAKMPTELKEMLVEEVEELGKKMHQLAEEYETACKAGDGFQAYFVLGQLRNMIFPLMVMGKRCHEMNQPNMAEDVVYGTARIR